LSTTRADRVIAFIEKFCRVPEGALVGSPIRLEPFQKDFIRDVYDNPAGTLKAYLSEARKNGKSATIACLVLVHLVGPEAKQNTQIISGAMSREQASIIYSLTSKMIDLNPELAALTRTVPSRKEIYGLPMNVQYRAISSQATTAHGLSPVLAIGDEWGQIRGPQSEFVDAITTSQGAHADPLLIVISTQAAEDGDWLSLALDDAMKSGDPRIVCHVYAAPEGCELDDPEAWKAANPALGVFRSLADVEQQAAEAKRMPSVENTFRNLVLNQRVSTVSPFMSRSVWESCGDSPRPLSECHTILAGLDLAKVSDLAAFVLIGLDDDGYWNVHPYFWTPAQGLMDRARQSRIPFDVWVEQGFLRAIPGPVIEFETVAREVLDAIEGLDVQGVSCDRWKIEELKDKFQGLGVLIEKLNLEKGDSRTSGALAFIEWGQGYKSMTPALEETEAQFLKGRVRHGMNPVMTACASAAVVTKDPAGGRKLDKAKATGKIDGLQAMCMAFGLASKVIVEKPAPSYDIFFI